MPKKIESPRFAVCINNSDYAASLETGKLYQLVADAPAEKHGLLRVIDESGEDYCYSAERFVVLAVPHDLAQRLKVISANRQHTASPKPTRDRTTSKVKPARVARRQRKIA